MNWIYIIIVGAIAGWLAGLVMRGGRSGLISNILLGIGGAFVGDYIFDYLNISVAEGMLGSVIEAFAGSVVILLVVGIFRRR